MFDWFKKLNRLRGAAQRLQHQREINDLQEEREQLLHLLDRWERGETIEIQIGPPGYPSRQLRVVSHCTADDAHRVSTPLRGLLYQNEQMLAMLMQFSTDSPLVSTQ